jgi:hypothetical protein
MVAQQLLQRVEHSNVFHNSSVFVVRLECVCSVLMTICLSLAVKGKGPCAGPLRVLWVGPPGHGGTSGRG